MIRLTIDRDRQRVGSVFVHPNAVELRAVDQAALWQALEQVVAALQGRDHLPIMKMDEVEVST